MSLIRCLPNSKCHLKASLLSLFLFTAVLTSCGLFGTDKPTAPGPCSNWAKDSLVVAEILRINGMKDSAISAWAKSGELPVKCVDGRVVQLGMSKLDSTGNEIGYDTLPPQIAQLTSLETLGGSGGGVSHIPKEIANLNKLRTLSLLNNLIDQLPTEMLQMTSLKELRLDHNSFDSFPEILCQMNKLITVSISNNTMHTFPTSCKGMVNLETLFLDFNSFTSFPEGVLDLPNTASIFLAQNHICTPIPDTTQAKIRIKGWGRLIESYQDCE